MRDGIREKELSDLGIEATVEHLDKGRVLIECDVLALDELLNVEDRDAAYHEGHSHGYDLGRSDALAEIQIEQAKAAEAKAS
jgi:hypothetical protein